MFEQDQDIKKEKKAVELYLRRIGVGYRDEGFVPTHGSSA